MSNLRANIFSVPLVFVDIETNGLNHVRGRVIEVAAIRIENGKITKIYRSLVDPQTELPYFITNLTGITSQDLKSAPTFDQIADELYSILEGAVFVAHNVRFDYSFLKQEFGRLAIKFLPKQVCTVKLSRVLYPHLKGHKLADIIQRHNFKYSARHRAYDDAEILWQFMQYINKNFTPEQINSAVELQIHQPSIPKNLQPELVRNLPQTTGVYIFEDASGKPLYVGKSINIKKRVLSHFGRDHIESKEFKIAQFISSIQVHTTAGELSALLLESRLVKELQPLYNKQLRRTSKLILARQRVNDEGYITINLEEASNIDSKHVSNVLAVYSQRTKAKNNLNILLKQYELCPKLMGLEKSAGSCFLYQLRKCRGACFGNEPAREYNSRLLAAFSNQRVQAWPYNGAIIIEEGSQLEQVSAFVVDKWCVLGEIVMDNYCDPVLIPRSRHFDLDTYKILQAFLSKKINKLRVRSLSDSQLYTLLNIPESV